MRSPRSPFVAAALLVLANAAWSCHAATAPTDAGADGGPADMHRPCTTHVAPGAADQTTVQTALINAAAGDVICFDDGTYHFAATLTIPTQDITLQGTTARGAVLDFSGQVGDNAIYATGDGFTFQYLVLQNTSGNGVRVEGADPVTFRAVHALWTAGPVTANGSYALYPVGSGHVLIEDCEVEDAADAGIYVGQSHDVIVRRNRVHANVAGIEFENCTNSCGYDNVAYDNTAGILVFNLPGLMVPGGGHALIHDNESHNNDRANFCHPGAVVCGVPQGVGVMVMAADYTQLQANSIHDNGGVGVLIVDYRVNGPMVPAGYDPTPDHVGLQNNTFANNGASAQGLLVAFVDADTMLGPDVLWDGNWDVASPGTPCADNTTQVCLPAAGNATTRFRCGDARDNYMHQTTDLATHDCPCTGETCVVF